MLNPRNIKSTKLLGGIIAGAVLAILPALASADLMNTGFESNGTPSVGEQGGYVYQESSYTTTGFYLSNGAKYNTPTYDFNDDSSVYWKFYGYTGIAANQSAFNVSGADSGYAAFLQSYPGYPPSDNLPPGDIGPPPGYSSLYQSFTLSSPEQAIITFSAEGRAAQSGANPFDVLVDGNVVLSVSANQLATSSFSGFKTAILILPAGSNTVTFEATKANSSLSSDEDYTSFIDDVHLVAVPAPLSWSAGATLMAVLGLLKLRRRVGSVG
jgi:hypothetical protein